MKDELLNYLKSSIERDWLHYYSPEAGTESENYSSLVYRRTEEKIAEISSLSIQDGQKPAIFIVEDNPIEFVSTFLAGVIAQVHLFLCDRTWQQREWQQVLNLVKPDFIFGSETVKSLVGKLAIPTTSETLATEQSLIMIPTGGTSGKIKFAMHSWSTLTASVLGFQEFFDCQTINSWCTLPLYHVSGLMQLMRSLLTQGNLVICPYQQINPEIDQDRGTYFISLVPTQLQFLLDSHPDWLKKFKTVLVGGAPSERSLLDSAREHKIAIALIYGSTETASGVVALKPEDFLTGNSSSGRVLPHAQVSINQTSASKPPESKARSGLIAIASTSLCLGYYPQFLTDSHSLITDDLGYIDPEGYIHLLGRNSHKIITGGENVFPTEVEAAIYATKLINDVCVIGIPDRKWGQTVTAVYSLRSASDSGLLDSIKQQTQLQLAKYKQPKNWIQVDRLPRNNCGKVNYQQLKAIAIKKVLNNQLSPSKENNN